MSLVIEYIYLYTDISRQSCDPETPHKAVSVRCAFPAVSSPMHVVKWHLALLSCLFFFFLFCYKAIVCSLNQRDFFFTVKPKHVSYMSECVMAQHTILPSSKSFTSAMELLQQFYELRMMARSFNTPRHHWFTNAA